MSRFSEVPLYLHKINHASLYIPIIDGPPSLQLSVHTVVIIGAFKGCNFRILHPLYHLKYAYNKALTYLNFNNLKMSQKEHLSIG